MALVDIRQLLFGSTGLFCLGGLGEFPQGDSGNYPTDIPLPIEL